MTYYYLLSFRIMFYTPNERKLKSQWGGHTLHYLTKKDDAQGINSRVISHATCIIKMVIYQCYSSCIITIWSISWKLSFEIWYIMSECVSSYVNKNRWYVCKLM